MLERLALRPHIVTTSHMQTPQSPGRLVALLSIGFVIGVACSCAVYWLFVAPSGGSDQLADTVVAPPSVAETYPSTQLLIAPTEASNTPEPLMFPVRNLNEIASMRSASEQQLAIRVLLSDLNEAQVAELLIQSQDIFEDEDWSALHSAIVQRLAHQNPSRALSLVLDADNSYNLGPLVTHAFREWAHSNLDEAVSYARTLDPDIKAIALGVILRERTDLSENTIRAIARDLGDEQRATSTITQRKIDEAIDDPEKAWNELALELQDDQGNTSAILRIANAWVEESGLNVLDQVYESLTNIQVRQDVIRNVLFEVAQTDPAGAFNYAVAMNDQYNSMVSVVASTWARSDPRSALSAAIEIKKVSARKAAAEEVVRAWARSEPRELLEGIDALPTDLQEAASVEALSEIAIESPQEAADLVAAMVSGSVKTSSASSVVRMWSRHDHTAALEWILNEPGVEEIRSDLLYSIMHTLVSVDPELAMTTALAQPIEETDSRTGIYREELGMEFTVISMLAYSDPKKAIELLPQVREGQTRFESFETVAQSLLRNGEIDQAFNIAQQVPDSDREQFYLAVTTAWAGSDPVGMLNSMNRFPSEDAMSRAALVLVMSNHTSKTLSDEQVEEAKRYISEEHARALKEGDVDFLQSFILGN